MIFLVNNFTKTDKTIDAVLVISWCNSNYKSKIYIFNINVDELKEKIYKFLKNSIDCLRLISAFRSVRRERLNFGGFVFELSADDKNFHWISFNRLAVQTWR